MSSGAKLFAFSSISETLVLQGTAGLALVLVETFAHGGFCTDAEQDEEPHAPSAAKASWEEEQHAGELGVEEIDGLMGRDVFFKQRGVDAGQLAEEAERSQKVRQKGDPGAEVKG